MNLVQLRYLKTIASTGSFSKSARLCGVSQPTISNAVSELENELKAKLFRRTTRMVEPTPFGESILGFVDDILNLVEDIQDRADARLRPERKVIKVGWTPVVSGARLMDLFQRFADEYGADVEFGYEESSREELESAIEKERVDAVCGIHFYDRNEFSRAVLYWDVLRLIPNGEGCTFNVRDFVTLEEAATERLILTVDACGLAPATRDLFRRRGLDIVEYDGHPLTYLGIEEWARQGIGAAVLPESRISQGLDGCPVLVSDGRPVMMAVEAIWARRECAPEHIVAFTRYLRESLIPESGQSLTYKLLNQSWIPRNRGSEPDMCIHDGER